MGMYRSIPFNMEPIILKIINAFNFLVMYQHLTLCMQGNFHVSLSTDYQHFFRNTLKSETVCIQIRNNVVSS